MYDKLAGFSINSLDSGSLDIKATGTEQSPLTDNQGAPVIVAGNSVQPTFTSDGVVSAARALITAMATEHATVHQRNTATIAADGTLIMSLAST